MTTDTEKTNNTPTIPSGLPTWQAVASALAALTLFFIGYVLNLNYNTTCKLQETKVDKSEFYLYVTQSNSQASKIESKLDALIQMHMDETARTDRRR